jgi:hypothetical protein
VPDEILDRAETTGTMTLKSMNTRTRMAERDSFLVPLDLEDRCREISLMMKVGGLELLGVGMIMIRWVAGKPG